MKIHLAFSLVYSLFSPEEEGDRSGACMRADGRSDIIYLNAFNLREAGKNLRFHSLCVLDDRRIADVAFIDTTF